MDSARNMDSLRGPLIGVILIPVAALLLLTGTLLVDRGLEVRRMDRLMEHVTLAAGVRNLVEALQMERGASVGFLSGQDQAFRRILGDARGTTDAQVEAFLQQTRGLEFAVGTDRADWLDAIRDDLKGLAQHREEVDRLALHPLEILPPYTRMVRRLVLLASTVPEMDAGGGLFARLDAYRTFLLMREYAGLERALGSAWLRGEVPDPLVFRRYVEAVSVQEFLRTQFLAMTPDSRRRDLEAVEGTPAHQELLAARAAILNQGAAGPPAHLSPVRWFRVSSERLRHLSGIETGLTRGLMEEARAIRERVQLQWWLLAGAVLMLLALTTALSALIARRLLCRERERWDHARRIEYLAHHDALTDLPNRRHFARILQGHLEAARASGGGLALCLLDLEGFSEVNRIWGEETADQVLKEVADRLVALAGPAVPVARVYGDQFALCLAGDAQRVDVQDFTARVLEVLDDPIRVGQRLIELRGNLGVVICPPLPGTVSDLMADAVFAVEQAKAEPVQRRQVFDPERMRRHAERAHLDQDLERALERGELEVHYQPQVELATGRMTRLEALLRWHHPRRGSVSPAVFIPRAEATGAIIAIGDFVLQSACRQLRRWRDRGLGDLSVAVNLSTVQLYQADLVARVRCALEEAGLPAPALELEITETGIMQDLETARAVMQDLRALGVRLSVDDFGTGYSSLAYLTRLPVQTLKLDRSFVADLEGSGEGRKVAEAVLGLADSLSLEVVAEGIETSAQAAWLRQRACAFGQGFLYARPLPPEACMSLLAGAARGHPQEEAPFG
ncbi:putative bifunctional diguanylate cyclase/phosphodiesterase [Ectothiorhodospira mobilis]|uniref:putative bifunctional diguanylate cyclase/phosphodiesterase n=1 Tax=Ectothiorhodospira mobilis TaxID=195064 RepID=UPI0019067FF8|nr:EAL domain-containing protein [Ectothiorhodospira mobilis]MBK1692167.1 hypothetical protein [Ectothiorhodospira mobilis]